MFAHISLVSLCFLASFFWKPFLTEGEVTERRRALCSSIDLSSSGSSSWIGKAGHTGPHLPLLSPAFPWSVSPSFLISLGSHFSERWDVVFVAFVFSPDWPALTLGHWLSSVSHHTWPWLWYFFEDYSQLMHTMSFVFSSQRMFSVLYRPSILAELVFCSVGEAGYAHKDL